jgi:sugar phosphate isomerase/epimerase
MSITRRGFFAAGSAVAATAALAKVRIAADEPKPQSSVKPQAKAEAVLKLSSQLGVIPGKDLAEKLANLEQWGFDGVELGGDAVGHEQKFADAIKKTKLTASALCGGQCCANGDLVSENVEKRAPAMEKIKRVLDTCGELHLTGAIYVPAFNGQTKLGNKEVRKILIDTLPELGEHAAKAGTRLILEPLNRREAYFLRQVADGAAIARDCHSPGIAVMGDFYHMYYEETSDLGAFISGGSYVHHVHMASAHKRVLPGQDERQYVDGFRGLKWIGYHDFCSLECGVSGDAHVEIPKSVAWLRDQWAQA